MALLLSSPASPLKSSSSLSQVKSNASWTIKKIRDRNFHDVFEPIENNPSLVWEANRRGWTCIHMACATNIPQRWWEWLLQRASIGHKELLVARTENGQTPIDLYFRTNLFPYLWQDAAVQRNAKQLRIAVGTILDSKILIDELRLCIQDMKTDRILGSNEQMMIKTVFEFWQRMECLLTVAYYGRLDMGFRQKQRSELVLAISNLAWCPELVAKLAVRLFPRWNQASRYRALQIWASKRSSFERYPEGDCGLLSVLCDYYSSTPFPNAHIATSPLNVALRMGKCWSEVEPLFDTFPESVNCYDVQWHVPLFCLPAAVPIDEYQVEMIARWRGNQTGVWHYLSNREKEKEIGKAREMVECERVETIYRLLRKNPSVVSMR